MNKITTTLLILLIFLYSEIHSQSTAENMDKKGWHLKDQGESGFYGISVEKAYNELLKNATPKRKIIVAVIDSGVDTLH